MIDAHQHFWSTGRGDYGWLTPDEPLLYRDFGPADLAPLIDAAGITGTVLVQAAPTIEETRYLLDLAEARAGGFVAAVIGWVPLDANDVAAHLDGLARHTKLAGVRPMIQDIPDVDWMLGSGVENGLRALSERDLVFEALVHPRHLSNLSKLVGRHPGLRIVVDHGAKPAIRDDGYAAWSEGIASVAREASVHCKLSGLVTEAAAGWRVEDLRRYVDHLLECFGPSRLMWGSDWPVVEIGGGFERWRRATHELLAELSEHERAEILGGTAERFYRLSPTTDAHAQPNDR